MYGTFKAINNKYNTIDKEEKDQIRKTGVG